MVIHDKFADFVLFLYVHMAYADGEYHPSEEEAILNKIPKLFPNEGEPNKKLKATIAQYKEVKPADLKKLISETFLHFDQVKFSQKYKIYTDMFDIVNADGKIHEAEERALTELKEIIEAGTEVDKK
jgi:uncharacterized tellurite resistance protein B-like protein